MSKALKNILIIVGVVIVLVIAVAAMFIKP